MRFTRDIAHGLRIRREDNTKVTAHTIDDWGLAIVNTDYIGEPELDTSYIYVPFMNGRIDATEAVSGRPIYKKRKINIKLKGFRERMNWDFVISDIRNKFNGRICQLIFDNDKNYYWRGRVSVEGFSRAKKCGYFNIVIEEADPYKYDIRGSADSWIWDTFNFLTDSVKTVNEIEVDGTATYKTPTGYMLVAPTFVCRGIVSDTFTVSDGKHEVTLINGSNYDPRLLVNGEEEVELTFRGKGAVTVVYRGGSL